MPPAVERDAMSFVSQLVVAFEVVCPLTRSEAAKSLGCSGLISSIVVIHSSAHQEGLSTFWVQQPGRETPRCSGRACARCAEHKVLNESLQQHGRLMQAAFLLAHP